MSEKSAAQILRAARELIIDPERWTQEEYARSAKTGRSVSPVGRAACKWCAIGAVARALNTSSPRGAEQWLDSRGVDSWGLLDLNEEGTHAEVIAAFDRAIELAEKRGA